MKAHSVRPRVAEGTRGQIVALLRRGARTVEDLAHELDLTDNAIRNHLTALERDGVVGQIGVRRGPGAGKPAVVYELHADAEALFSKAYAPVLRALVGVIADELPAKQGDAVLRRVGNELAKTVGGKARGNISARVHAAAAVLNSLGGDSEVTEDDGVFHIRGFGCPLSATVAHHPEVCHAVEALVGDIAGARARSQCEHGARPRCRFAIAANSKI